MSDARFYVVETGGKVHGPLPKWDAKMRAKEVAGSSGKVRIEVEQDDGSRSHYTTIDRTDSRTR